MNNTQVVTSHWTRKAAASFKPTDANTMPVIDPYLIPQVYLEGDIWDIWDVRNLLTNKPALVRGFKVIVGLVHPKGKPDEERIAFLYSPEGGDKYRFGGFMLKSPVYALIREWSGSTVICPDGCVKLYYTISYGMKVNGVFQTVQRFALAELMPYLDGSGGLAFKTLYHRFLKEPDGIYYETPAQASWRELMRPCRHVFEAGADQTENHCFRDPYVYHDDLSGWRGILFEANTGPANFPAGSVRREFIGRGHEPDYQPTDDDLKANGCVGVMEFTDADGRFGNFLKPWLTTNLVTDEIERITVIRKGNYYYLFGVVHGNKMTQNVHNPDLVNRDFLIGFRASRLFGRLTPLNGSGVVINQKSEGPIYVGQAENQQYVYSWQPTATDNPDVMKVRTYSNYSRNAAGDVVAARSAGPTVMLEVKGLSTRIINIEYDIQMES